MSTDHKDADLTKRLILRHDGINDFSHWKGITPDGDEVLEIKLHAFSIIGQSHFEVWQDGTLKGRGGFEFGVWDEANIKRVLRDVVRSGGLDVELEYQGF